MSTFIKRALLACATGLIALAGTAAPAAAETAKCEGVWVVVQRDQADPATAVAKCASEYSDGVKALASAGFETESSETMLTRIDGLPKDADFNTNGGYYWSYWSASVDAEGNLSDWSYYTTGPNASKPSTDKAEGWLLTNDQAATGPAVKNVNSVTAATSPAPTTGTSTDAQGGGSPTGTIIAGIAVLVAVLGLGAWWLARRRRG